MNKVNLGALVILLGTLSAFANTESPNRGCAGSGPYTVSLNADDTADVWLGTDLMANLPCSPADTTQLWGPDQIHVVTNCRNSARWSPYKIKVYSPGVIGLNTAKLWWRNPRTGRYQIVADDLVCVSPVRPTDPIIHHGDNPNRRN